MLKNHLIIALRNLLRNKTFSLINILGLSISLTTFLAISLYVADEFSFDRFHQNKDRIYRAIISASYDGQTNRWGGAPNKLGPAAAKDIPEIEKATRLFHHNFGDLAFVSTETEKFSESQLFYADPEILEIFTIPLIKGNSATALARPGTVLLGESAAKKYFGDKDPIGQTLQVDNRLSLEVTGIYRDFPANSFLQCQLLASFSSNWFGNPSNQNWGNASFDTFFLLHEGVSGPVVEKKIEALLERQVPKDQRWYTIALQPLPDIRLRSGDLTASIDRRQYGDLGQVKIMIALALVILLIAAVNYMNLTTAQAQRRNKEVGISKTLGATAGHLRRKFYFEASVFALLSMLISLAIFSLGLPIFNELSGKSISADFFYHAWFWVGFAGVWLSLTLLSGSYPAAYLSSFSPKSILQKTSQAGAQVTLRKGLVVFQFTVSIILIICSVVFYKQMNFIRDRKLGYEPGQVVAVMMSAAQNREQVNSVQTEFETLGGVSKVCQSQSFPGMGTSSRNVNRDGDTGQGSPILTTRASAGVLEVLGIKLIAGKTLPEHKDAADTTVQVVINKTAADYLRLTPQDAIGKLVNIQGFSTRAEVVGVTEDFNVTSLHQKIGAYCFHNAPTERLTYLLVKLDARNLTSSVDNLRKVYNKIIPAAFEFSFLDQQMERMYQAEKRLSQVVLLFAGLAIFIACLGLYALASFTAEQRVKEIGIRKVMGASGSQIVGMLSRDFIVLVIISFLLSVPLGYYVMDKWLQAFAYRVEFDVLIFGLAGILAVSIAWLTVSFESWKAARRNPVDSLRSE